MQNLSKKTQATRLFSDAQKVDLLVALPEASEEDKMKLEEGIDTFDREYKKAITKRSHEIRSLVSQAVNNMDDSDKAKSKDALDELELGFALLAP